MLSRAGRLHSDLKASQDDDLLKHMLFAAANTE
jgi:hypothetical protein